jgi:hypothetical protein
MTRQNIPTETIAHALDSTPETIRKVQASARDKLKLAADVAVDSWIAAAQIAGRKGYHGPAKDLLVYSETIKEPLKPVDPDAKHVPSVVVQLGFALPGLPTPLPVIDAKPEPTE